MGNENDDSDDEIRALVDVRNALIHLHRSLLEAEKISFEKKHGRIRSRGEFLQLVTEHEWFSWLRPLSELVAEIDESVDSEEGMAEEDIERYLNQVRFLLRKSQARDSFSRKFYEVLEKSPDVIMAFGEVSARLKMETIH